MEIIDKKNRAWRLISKLSFFLSTSTWRLSPCLKSTDTETRLVGILSQLAMDRRRWRKILVASFLMSGATDVIFQLLDSFSQEYHHEKRICSWWKTNMFMMISECVRDEKQICLWWIMNMFMMKNKYGRAAKRMLNVNETPVDLFH